MADKTSASEKLRVTITTYRWGFGIAGLVAIAMGIFVLVWPNEMVKIAALLVGIYAVLSGLVYIFTAIRAKELKSLARITRVVAGIAFITAGLVMLSFLSASAVVLANVLGVILGILWMVEGVSALMLLRGRVEQNALATGYAIVALVIGVLLLLTPVWGTAFLRWMIGFGLVLLGIAQVYRAAMASREIKVNIEVKEG
ncbi:HdeD family acid-resistance protein [Actinomyces minihominis]|uniref:HdeD family acid-resistance protein n=1 Tax=Actinomyces minihominis TaxID=2002838 RepID=UPI000C082114|nr:DUF308 domain-containing protein [Actinomyces minihominis]